MSSIMKCPECGSLDSRVLNTRSRNENTVIWRQRQCKNCALRWGTWESNKLRSRPALAWEQLTDEQRRILSKIINDFAKANDTDGIKVIYMRSA